MFIIRWLSLVLRVIAVMLLGADLVSTLEKHALFIRSIEQILMLFGADAKLAVQANFPAPDGQCLHDAHRLARLGHVRGVGRDFRADRVDAAKTV